MDLLTSLLMHKDGARAPISTSLVPQACRQIVSTSCSRTTHTEDRAVSAEPRHSKVVRPVTMNEYILPPSGQGKRFKASYNNEENVRPSVHQVPIRELDNLYSLDEWDKLHPPTPPTTKMTAIQANLSDNGMSAVQFNNLCQQHGLPHDFTFREIAKGCFTAKVTFGSHGAENPEPFSSKRAAKETICRQAIQILQMLPPPIKAAKRKDSSRNSSESGSDTAVKVQENYVSLLQECCQQQHKEARPAYNYFEASTRNLQKQGLALTEKQFASTVVIPQAKALIFGSEETLFTTKAEAKRHAAIGAVHWLRANGHMCTTRKPHRSITEINKNATSVNHAGLTQAVAPVALDGHTRLALTYAQRVHNKSLALGFTQPRFEVKPSVLPATGIAAADVGAYVDLAAFYSEQDVEREPKLAGPVGGVRHVFGRKNAKEACCKEVLDVL